MSSTLAGLKPLILHSFIEYTQFVTIDDTDAMPLCRKKTNNKNKTLKQRNNVLYKQANKTIHDQLVYVLVSSEGRDNGL